jgi:hypothetical protein
LFVVIQANTALPTVNRKIFDPLCNGKKMQTSTFWRELTIVHFPCASSENCSGMAFQSTRSAVKFPSRFIFRLISRLCLMNRHPHLGSRAI